VTDSGEAALLPDDDGGSDAELVDEGPLSTVAPAGAPPSERSRRAGDDEPEIDRGDLDDDVDEGDVDDDVDEGDVDDDVDEGDDEGDVDVGNQVLAPVATAVLTHIARSVVDDVDAVEIDAVPLRGSKIRLAVHVAPNDFGRLIGRRGRVAAAIRTLVGAAAVKDGLDVEVEFVE
jgi:predicted RNA-binding protein YlqC (UPF0109 family)